MKPRNLLIVAGFLGLLAPASLLAADATKPKATQCEKVTGSIIRPSEKKECKSASSQPMRTYTKEDIDRTGEISVAQALRKLDPRFQ